MYRVEVNDAPLKKLSDNVDSLSLRTFPQIVQDISQ